jgi:transcriptional regulator with XRE-family HTH domain
MVDSPKERGGERVVRSRVKQIVADIELRTGKTIKNKEIAEAIGITETTAGRWLQPKPVKKIEVDVALRLADFLGVPWHELFVEEVVQHNE